MEEIVQLFVNNGTAVACLIYFMWYNNTTMKEVSTNLKANTETLAQLINKLP